MLDEALDECRSVLFGAVPQATLVEHLDRVHVIAQRVAAVHLALVREIDARGVAVAQGASSTTAWLRDRHRISGGAARQLSVLARALDTELPTTAAALADGTINVEQVKAIAASVSALPADVRGDGETHLVEQATVFGPRELGVLGQRLFEVLDPQRAEATALAALDRAEQRAHHDRCLYLTDVPGTGQVRLTGWLPHEAAATVRAALDPPRPTVGTTAGSPTGTPAGVERLSAGQRRADNLVDVCRLASPSTQFPDNGGSRPQIVVTTSLDTLREQTGTATLDDGTHLSAATARRLACDAAIIPAVLDGAGQVLDLGRERRLFTGPIRRALTLRDRGCAFPACDRPPRWCDAHHIIHWANGGTTSLHNAVLLCRHHHRLIHHNQWTVHINPANGKPAFIPPAHLDPHQRPQHNRYHQGE